MNEKIIEAAYESQDDTVIYTYPNKLYTKYKVYFNKKLQDGDSHTMWNQDMQTGALSKLKRL